MADSVRGQLGDFLRARRESLQPGAFGLASGKKRRTPGLRREEVAERAGIGVDWYTRLEQGRNVTPSSATLDALAGALRLDTAEAAHLRALARRTGTPVFVRETVPAVLERLVANLSQPAYITGRRWDVLAWNQAAVDIITDFGRFAEPDRNVMVYMLTDPDARRLFGAGWAAEARRMVAQFRATCDLWAGDPSFVELVQRLHDHCPEFDGWWKAHDIRGMKAGQKPLQHPEKGLLRYEYASFQANDDPALKLVIYTPVG